MPQAIDDRRDLLVGEHGSRALPEKSVKDRRAVRPGEIFHAPGEFADDVACLLPAMRQLILQEEFMIHGQGGLCH